MKKFLLYTFKFIVLAILFVAYVLNKEIGFMPSGLLVFIGFLIGAGVWSINPSSDSNLKQNQ